MLSVSLLPGIQGIKKKKMSKKRSGRLEGNILLNMQVTLRHIKVVACSVPECHTVLIHVLLEQLRLALAKPFQQLAFHSCQNDWVVWMPSKAHSFPSNLDCLRLSVSERKMFPSDVCYRNWWKHHWTWLNPDMQMVCCKFILAALDHKCQI